MEFNLPQQLVQNHLQAFALVLKCKALLHVVDHALKQLLTQFTVTHTRRVLAAFLLNQRRDFLILLQKGVN